MEKLQKIMQGENSATTQNEKVLTQKQKVLIKSERSFWVLFDSKENCKAYLKEVKNLGYKWFTGEEIDLQKELNFYFTLEVDKANKTVGFVPNFQRFLRSHRKILKNQKKY